MGMNNDTFEDCQWELKNFSVSCTAKCRIDNTLIKKSNYN